MKNSAKWGMRFLDIVLTFPFVIIGSISFLLVYKFQEQNSVKIIFTSLGIIMCYLVLVLVRHSCRKIDMRIEYGGEVLNLYLEEKISVDIREISAFSTYIQDLSSYKQTIEVLHLRIVLKDNSTYDFLSSAYDEEELKELFSYCKQVNLEIEDDYFKFIKFGILDREGTIPYYERKGSSLK